MERPETSLSAALPERSRFVHLPRLRLRRLLLLSAGLLLSAAVLGGGSVPAGMTIWRSIDRISEAWSWDIVGWEISSVGAKLAAQAAQPLAALTADEQARLVRDYLRRAAMLAQLEWQLDQLYMEPAPGAAEDSGATADTAAPEAVAAQRRQIEAQITVLQEQQALVRGAVEQAIQGQVSAVLGQEQIGALGPAFPPVWFTFTEPPSKLVASPRDRIETAYYAMIQPDLPADERERIETDIRHSYNLSAYVAPTGGLGAYPAIVTDQAPLGWVLSTVAHEWVHNYLTLFPLGFHYDGGPELTILNETIADIAGDELGAAVLAQFYPESVREFPGKDEPAPSALDAGAPPFDFEREMRQTRQVTDLFLAAGRVEDAEEYMQIRRLLFQENGYGIRKLNQAYFAFHGNYGTGSAASSPIGPKLQQLRALMPDLRTFLETVRWFTSEADLDAAIKAWRAV